MHPAVRKLDILAMRRRSYARKNLTVQGVFQEVHFDGHEKLTSAALRMGPVGIAVYGARDKGSSVTATPVAVPDARQSVIVGHLYLDFVQEFGGKYMIIEFLAPFLCSLMSQPVRFKSRLIKVPKPARCTRRTRP